MEAKLKNYILEKFFELPKEAFISKLCELSNIFSKHILEYNHTYLETLQAEIDSVWLQNLIDFYNNTLFPQYDAVADSSDEFLLRLGSNTEWHSKTVGMAIMNYFLDKRERTMTFGQFYDRINRLKLFKGQNPHKSFETTPISRAYVVDHRETPQFPLGWIKAHISYK